MADYITYTSALTATANSTAVTGSGTAFVTDGLRAGDWLWLLESAGPVGYPIASVESATALTLGTAYKGSTGGSKSAIGMRRWDEEKASDTYRLVNSYIQSLEGTVSVSQAGIRYVYSTTTGMSDPGAGFFRFNNASPASATAIAFADESGETGNPDASAFINTFDDSTSATKGYIYIKKAGEPQTFMIYAVTGLTDNSGWSQLAVTYITGNGSMVNNDPVRLEFYRVGNDGFENGLKLAYSTSTTDADPGTGIFRFNSGTFASITQIYMDNAEINGVSITSIIDSWDDSTNTAHRGTLRIQKVGDPTTFREFSITGAITDGTGYRKIPVSPSVSNGTWTNGNTFVVLFTRTGNAGASGYVPGYKFTYSTTTTDSDPGAGVVRMNNATFGSISSLFVDNTDSGGNTITTWLDSLDDSTDAVRGILRFEKQDDPTIYREFQVTGSVTNGTGYRKISVTPLVSGGSWTNGIAINATFYRTGNDGADGYAPGFRYTYSNTTTDGDPGAGTMRLNSGTHSSATFAYIDNADAAGATVTTWLDGLDDSTQTNHRGYLRIQKASDPAIYCEYVVTGAVTDGTGYRKVPISHVASAGVLSDSDTVVLTFSRSGNVGIDGIDGVQSGYRFTYDDSTTDGDPGAGELRFNNATFASISEIYIDDADTTGADVEAWIQSLDDATSAVRGTLRMEQIGDPTTYREFQVTGNVTDGTGYWKIPVSPIASSGTLTAADVLAVTWFRSGDAGTATVAEGDKGDITVTDSGATWTIDAQVVTNAKLSNMSANTLKGRYASGTGDPEDLDADEARVVITADGSPFAGFRNHIINGAMMVAQRGTSFTSATTPANNDDTYLLDRWTLLSDGNDIVDVTRATDAPTDGLNSIGLDVETVNKKFGIIQFIEQKNCIGLIGNTVTLSFKARASSIAKLDNVKAAIIAWSGTADSVTSDVVSAWGSEGTNPTLVANWTYENTPANLGVTTSWATYQVTATIDTASAKNVAVMIWSDVTDTTLGDFLYITDVQLEIGSVATPFERRPYGTELALCHRYYYRTPDMAVGSRHGVGFATSTAAANVLIAFPCALRIAPSSIETSGTATDYTLSIAGSNINCSAVPSYLINSSTNSIVTCTVASGLTSNGALILRAAQVAGYLAWSAEL
jgi:hypothetical protein